MTEEHGENKQWDSCAGGEISGMVQGIHNRRRRWFMMQLAGGAMAAVLVGVLFVEFRPNGQLNAGVMTCEDVRNAAEDFLKCRVSPEQKERIAAHLKDCPHCKEMIRKMRNESGGGSRIQNPAPQSVSVDPAEFHAPALIAQATHD